MNNINTPVEGKSSVLLLTVLLITFGLTACASAPPKRTPYSGPDNVGAADANALVGTWSGRVLNPLEGEQVDSAIYNYSPDGTWTAEVNTSSGGLPIAMRGDGTWTAEGEAYMIVLGDMEIISENPAVKLFSKMLTSSFKKQAGPSNPYEISPDRIVLVSSHDQAIELTRQ